VHGISAALGGAAVLVNALAELTAIGVFRAANPDHDHPGISEITTGRLRFLGAVGMTVNPLTLTICAMVAIGVPLLGICHQS
jgi:hypothetical protein